MEEIRTFENPEFGAIRTVEKDGEPWFSGKDVAVALGYSNPHKAIRDHVDNEDKGVNETFNEKTGWAGTQTLVTPKGRETFRLLHVAGVNG